MNLDEFYGIIADYNNIKLRHLEEFNIGQANFLFLHAHYFGSFFENIKNKRPFTLTRCGKRILIRCISKMYAMERSGNGTPIFFISRNDVNRRKDHLNNVRSVCSLLENKTLIYGKRFNGFTFLNLRTLFYPFIWNRQLQSYIKDKKLRLELIENIYFEYIDFVEYLRYEKKHLDEIKGLVLLSEAHVSSQLIGQYFKNRELTTVALMHGLYCKGDANIVDRAVVYNSNCSYLISYSAYATEQYLEKEYGKYPKGIYELGPIHFVNKNLESRVITQVNKIGVYFDGVGNSCGLQSNLKMLQVVVDSFKDTDKEIYVKCHPSVMLEQIEYYKKELKSDMQITFYGLEALSLDLEKTTDVMILRNTSCLIEGVFQQIPTFIFDYPPVYFSGLPENIYFSTQEELKDLIQKVENGEMVQPLRNLKEYLCGKGNPTENYKKFFNDLGWT